jgi:hypothetical protein
MSRARDVADWLPVDGDTDEALVKVSVEDYDYTYARVGDPDFQLPPWVAGDEGKALVIDPGTGQPVWGAPVNSAVQIIDAGTFT